MASGGEERPAMKRSVSFIIPSPMRLVLPPNRTDSDPEVEELSSATDTGTPSTESANSVESIPEEMTKFLTRQFKVPKQSASPASPEPDKSHEPTRKKRTRPQKAQQDLIAVYRGEALVHYMGGEYEAARKCLKKVSRIQGEDDLHDLLLMAECSVLLSDETRNDRMDDMAALYMYMIDSDLSNERIQRWASLFFPRHGHNVHSQRCVGGVLLLCGLLKKYENEGMSAEHYVRELRDFTVGVDGIGYFVIKHNFDRRFPLITFFNSVRSNLQKKLVSYNETNAVDQACFDHGMITNFCVEENYERALQEAELAIIDIKRDLPNPSKYKIYGRLLLWEGVLRAKLGDVEQGIADMVKARTAMEDATDYSDDTDLAYLMDMVNSNINCARKGKADWESLRGGLCETISPPARPQVMSAAMNPKTASETVKPQAVSRNVKTQAALGAVKSQPVSRDVKPQAASRAAKPKIVWRDVKPQVLSRADKPQATSGVVKPQAVSRADKPKATSGVVKQQAVSGDASKPQAVSGVVKLQSKSGAMKATAVKHKVPIKAKSPRSKSKSRKSK